MLVREGRSPSLEALSLVEEGRLKGFYPFKTNPSPSPFKERGIKGVRLIDIPKKRQYSSPR